MACSSGCDYDCTDTCGISCATSCYNSCALGGCQGGCTSCQGCTGCSGCGGCGGCGGCTGNCTGHCDTACTAENMAQVIAELGENILEMGYYDVNDFGSLKNAIRNEFTRRNKTLPSDAYTIDPSNGGILYAEHPQKVLDDIHTFDSSKSYPSIGVENPILVNDISSAIQVIQTLMSQNTRP